MRIGIVLSFLITTKDSLDVTIQALKSMRSFKHHLSLYAVCNRSPLIAKDLRSLLSDCFCGEVYLDYEPGIDRSLAASWNHGLFDALSNKEEGLVIATNDIKLNEDTLDRLIDYGEENSELSLWTGKSNGTIWNRGYPLLDFSLFMLRRDTIERFGWFDQNYYPYYFEDTDYAYRIWLGGGLTNAEEYIQYTHYGSMTLTSTPEMFWRSEFAFTSNEDKFIRKWGTKEVALFKEDALKTAFSHPFNDFTKPLWWWPSVEDCALSLSNK